MSAAHTPGPWIEVELGHIRTQSLQLVAVAQHGINAKANARLIAAAPCLLEALQSIADYPELDALEMKREARAAIAKATGGAL